MNPQMPHLAHQYLPPTSASQIPPPAQFASIPTPQHLMMQQMAMQQGMTPSSAASMPQQALPQTHASSKQATYINRPDNFAALVSQIQFIHGDAEKPQENTVRVIEQYVRQKMMKMIIRARENMFRRIEPDSHFQIDQIALQQQGYTPQQMQQLHQQMMHAQRSQYQLTLDDFTFLNRHRLEKLTRLHTYLSHKRYEALKEKQQFALDINKCLYRENLTRLERMLTNTDDQYPPENPDEKPPRNMFLIRDNIDEARAKAAKQLVRDMNQSEFNLYSKCGSAVFKFSQDPKKFMLWLRMDKIRFEVQQQLLECLSYLAYEMVALVTQVSLLVKRNTELNREDDTSKVISTVTGVLDDAWKTKLSTVHLEHDESYEKAPSMRRPIQPGHVFEAIRRLEARDELFSKHYEFL